MKIPFSCPNLRIKDVVKAILISDSEAEKRISDYFSFITGKKHILITNSCRSALYLTYMALGLKGEVITSPLTCKVAIEPIIETGNTPIYADVNLGDLNIQSSDIDARVTNNTIAIQVIHTGGISCDMEKIMSIARKRNILVIEDCAQSLGALYGNKATGSFGNVSCFTLTKNAYGISGGILATDDFTIYLRAQRIMNMLKKTSLPKVLFAVIRNLLDTTRKNNVFFLFKYLMAFSRLFKRYNTVQGQLSRMSTLEKSIAAIQIGRIDILHQKRKKNGEKYYELLRNNDVFYNKDYDVCSASFTKLFVYNPKINAHNLIRELGQKGIEAMHLTQQYGSPYQTRIVSEDNAIEYNLHTYSVVHDHLIALPIHEEMSYIELSKVVEYLREAIIE